MSPELSAPLSSKRLSDDVTIKYAYDSSAEQKRPIAFIGHSLGGILIVQVGYIPNSTATPLH